MEKQPNSRNCFICGLSNPFSLKLSFYETQPGEVIANYTVSEHHQGYPGIVHGGIVAAMLDEIACRSLMGTGLKHPRFVYTARLTIRYRQHVPVEKPLRLVGTAGKSKARYAAATSAIYSAEGELLAEADVLVVNAPPVSSDTAELENIGWKVYPDC
jgi:acyl-coenzyme A thioesterase PaaI-like protein